MSTVIAVGEKAAERSTFGGLVFDPPTRDPGLLYATSIPKDDPTPTTNHYVSSIPVNYDSIGTSTPEVLAPTGPDERLNLPKFQVVNERGVSTVSVNNTPNITPEPEPKQTINTGPLEHRHPAPAGPKPTEDKDNTLLFEDESGTSDIEHLDPTAKVTVAPATWHDAPHDDYYTYQYSSDDLYAKIDEVPKKPSPFGHVRGPEKPEDKEIKKRPSKSKGPKASTGKDVRKGEKKKESKLKVEKKASTPSTAEDENVMPKPATKSKTTQSRKKVPEPSAVIDNIIKKSPQENKQAKNPEVPQTGEPVPNPKENTKKTGVSNKSRTKKTIHKESPLENSNKKTKKVKQAPKEPEILPAAFKEPKKKITRKASPSTQLEKGSRDKDDPNKPYVSPLNLDKEKKGRNTAEAITPKEEIPARIEDIPKGKRDKQGPFKISKSKAVEDIPRAGRVDDAAQQVSPSVIPIVSALEQPRSQQEPEYAVVRKPPKTHTDQAAELEQGDRPPAKDGQKGMAEKPTEPNPKPKPLEDSSKEDSSSEEDEESSSLSSDSESELSSDESTTETESEEVVEEEHTPQHKDEEKENKNEDGPNEEEQPDLLPPPPLEPKKPSVPVPPLTRLSQRAQLMGIFSIETYSTKLGAKCKPTGVAIGPRGDFIIVDYTDKSVKIFSKTGQLRVEFGQDILRRPWNVVLMPNGNLAVSDPGDMSIQVFKLSGEFVKKFEFPHNVEPYGIAVNKDGNVLVADKGANCIYVFDCDGFMKDSIKGSDSNIGLWPQYLAVDGKNDIIVSDYISHTVRIFSHSGKQKAQHGSRGSGQDELMCPEGVCVDQFGHIFVADNVNSRIKVLSPKGEFIRELVTKKEGLEGPEALAIEKQGYLVVTEETGSVKVFSYLM